MTRDDLIDKEVAEKLSKEVVSYIIEQVTKNERNQNQNLRLVRLEKVVPGQALLLQKEVSCRMAGLLLLQGERTG